MVSHNSYVSRQEKAQQHSFHFFVSHGFGPAGLTFRQCILRDRLHAAPFVDVFLWRIRGLAIDWAMHCPDLDGMNFYKPCALYFRKHARHTLGLGLDTISPMHDMPVKNPS